MHNWMVTNGMVSYEICSKCHAVVSSDEFDFDSDLCYSCLFPERPRHRPAEVTMSYGYVKNYTNDSRIIDNIDRIPQKQSRQAIARKKAFDMEKYARKTKSL